MGVVYRHTVEAFLGQVARRRSLFTHDELIALHAAPPRDLDIERWVALVRAAAAKLRPGAAADEALEETGREMVRGYREGLVGRSVFLVARLVGPRGMLLRLPETYRTADDVMNLTATARGPREVLLHCASVFGIPTYVRGVLSETMTVMGVRHSVSFSMAADGSTDFVVTWE